MPARGESAVYGDACGSARWQRYVFSDCAPRQSGYACRDSGGLPSLVSHSACVAPPMLFQDRDYRR